MTPNMRDAIKRVQQICSPLALQNSKHTRFKCPLPVWDSTGRMIGCSVTLPVVMGGQPCDAEATFVVDLEDKDTLIADKVQAAIAAVNLQIVCNIRTIKRQAEPA